MFPVPVPRDPDSSAYARHINLQLTYTLQNPHSVLQHLNNNNNSSINNNHSVASTMHSLNSSGTHVNCTTTTSSSNTSGSSTLSHHNHQQHSPKFALAHGGNYGMYLCADALHT